MPGARSAGIEHFSLFLFCGILPWTWFSSSLLESANALIAGGNLIRKVLFPAEILPIVTVFAGLVHFCLGLPILAAFFVYYRVPVPAGRPRVAAADCVRAAADDAGASRSCCRR